MQAIEWVMGIALVVIAVFLLIVVLMQSDKDKRLSGTIAGGADTYFGKGKGRSRDRLLARITTVVAILFAVLAVATYIVIAKK